MILIRLVEMVLGMNSILYSYVKTKVWQFEFFFYRIQPSYIYLEELFSTGFYSTVPKKKSHLIRKIAALLYFCILRIPVYKVYLSLLLWSMFAFTIFCYLFIPPCLLTHYFVYLTSCYRFIYVLVCFPIKRKT